MKDRITNTITRHIGVISESSRGWKLELNKRQDLGGELQHPFKRICRRARAAEKEDFEAAQENG